MECAEEGCTETFKDHRWGKIAAQEQGWILRRDGKKAWCPNHTPPWVDYWRARRAAKAKGF